MEWGLKVEGGDCFGKIIIFVCNYKYVEFIFEWFNVNYFYYKG